MSPIAAMRTCVFDKLVRSAMNPRPLIQGQGHPGQLNRKNRSSMTVRGCDGAMVRQCVRWCEVLRHDGALGARCDTGTVAPSDAPSHLAPSHRRTVAPLVKLGSALLQPLLQPILALLQPRLAFGAQLLRLLLLLGSQQRIHVAVETCLQDREFRLRLPKLLHHASNAPLVDRHGFHGIATRFFGPADLLDHRAALRAHLFGKLTNLLLLCVRQVEAPQQRRRAKVSRTRATTARPAETGSLRQRQSETKQHGDERRESNDVRERRIMRNTSVCAALAPLPWWRLSH